MRACVPRHRAARAWRVGLLASVMSMLSLDAGLASDQGGATETLESAWRQAFAADAELAASGATSESARASERAAQAGRWPALG